MQSKLRRMLQMSFGFLTIGTAFAVGRCTASPPEPKPDWDGLHSCVQYVDEMLGVENVVLQTNRKIQSGWNQCLADYNEDSVEIRRLTGEVNVCKFALSEAMERAARCQQ